MKEIRLKTYSREDTGKKSAHKLRKEGEIPGILYGHKQEARKLTVPEHDFWHILHNATTEHLILHLEVEGADKSDTLVLVRDVQHHPLTGAILHVDFQRISRDESIKVGVPIILTGVAKGVKEFGGVMDHGMREVKVMTTPTEVPESLEVDVSDLQIGQTLFISDLKKQYSHIEFLDDDKVSLVHISPPKKLEISLEEVAAAAAEEEVAEGEVEEEGEKGDES
ncbi:MAG: 50S ribosomal protein L25 [Candidatus Krumholzibacteriota bacterium]|nr:50S ribosomal protein L25 [Candidatus Krumholzibacteriota bacterium]